MATICKVFLIAPNGQANTSIVNLIEFACNVKDWLAKFTSVGLCGTKNETTTDCSIKGSQGTQIAEIENR